MTPIKLICLVSLHLFLSSLTQVEHGDGFVYQVILDLLVERTVGRERGEAVNFDEPRLDFIVEEDVDAEHFEAD